MIAPKLEKLFAETEFSTTQITADSLAAHEVPTEEDAEFYYLFANFTDSEAKEMEVLKQGRESTSLKGSKDIQILEEVCKEGDITDNCSRKGEKVGS